MHHLHPEVIQACIYLTAFHGVTCSPMEVGLLYPPPALFSHQFLSVLNEHAERNPNFRQDALAALPKNKTIAVMCSLGGTMLVGTKPREMSGKVFKSDPDRAFGRESRSLKACYELYEVSP